MAVYTCNPSNREEEIERSLGWGMLAVQSSQLASSETLSQKTNRQNKIFDIDLWSPHAHIPIYMLLVIFYPLLFGRPTAQFPNEYTFLINA